MGKYPPPDRDSRGRVVPDRPGPCHRAGATLSAPWSSPDRGWATHRAPAARSTAARHTTASPSPHARGYPADSSRQCHRRTGQGPQAPHRPSAPAVLSSCPTGGQVRVVVGRSRPAQARRPEGPWSRRCARVGESTLRRVAASTTADEATVPRTQVRQLGGSSSSTRTTTTPRAAVAPPGLPALPGGTSGRPSHRCYLARRDSRVGPTLRGYSSSEGQT